MGLLRATFLFPFCFLLTGQLPSGTLQEDEWRKLHFASVVADTHNDVVQRVLRGEDLGSRTVRGHSDIPRLVEGGVDIQMFSIWAPPEKQHRSYFDQANEQIDSIESLVRRNPGVIDLARNAGEATNLLARGKLAAMLGMEGGHHIMSDMKNLEHFFMRGVRYMTITWNNSTSWASSAYDETVQPGKLRQKGLTEFGKNVVRRMNELGMMVDVSHVGETTFWDIVNVTRRPIIASHSSVWKLCPHRRNLKDEQLKAIANSGGVVFINFLPNFIDSTFSKKEQKLRDRHKSRIDSLKKVLDGDWFYLQTSIAEMLKEEYKAIRPPLRILIDHFDYAIRLIGADHVGIGSDFDGIQTTPLDMDDVTFLPNITQELLKRGHPERDVQKVLGGNFVRILREVSQ